MKMGGKTILKNLIGSMEPELNAGDYVFTTHLSARHVPIDSIIGSFREKEGITFIVEKNRADGLKLPYEFVASWITLTVHSSLESVGLTAAFSAELAKNNIGCNVIAGYFHDHIFVAKKDREKAMNVLRNLAKKYK